MSESGQPLPAVRRIDARPMPPDEHGQQQFALFDPSGLSETQLALAGWAYFIVMHLDGQHTVADIEEAFENYFKTQLPEGKVAELVDVLDRALLLDNERFAEMYARKLAAFRAATTRDNRSTWPMPEALRVELDACLSAAEHPPVDNLVGLIAPHLDYERGKPCYARSYAILRQAPAARYVILGTNHFGGHSGTVATGKDFETQLGIAENDRNLLARVEARVGDLRAGEFDHQREHSIELQVHLLQHVCPQPFTILPLLIPDPSGPTGTQPILEDGPDLMDVLTALREEMQADGVPTVVIASADLSHVGQAFGETTPTTDDFLQQVADSDQAHLALLEARQEEQFVQRMRETQNPTRICSVGNLFAMLQLLPEGTCRITKYHQAIDKLAETHVTCASGYVTA